MLRIPELDGVVVNSNDDAMLDLARSLGAEAIKRADVYADGFNANAMLKNAAETFPGDIAVVTNCTNPCISDATVKECIQKYFEVEKLGYDSLNTVDDVKEFLWRDNQPLNYSPSNTPRSQDLLGIVKLNFAVNIIHKDRMFEMSTYVGATPYLHRINRVEALDVDDQFDFDFAEFTYKSIHSLM